MMHKWTKLAVFLLFSLSSYSWCGMFDIKFSEIKDSTSLINKILTPGDPLYSYFTAANSRSRMDITDIINEKVLPDPDFAFKATALADSKAQNRSSKSSDEKIDHIMGTNRDLLTELYPDEIIQRNPEIVKQVFQVDVPVKIVVDEVWLKAEIMCWLNEVMRNESISDNWKNIRLFFDSKVSEKEIQSFSKELSLFSTKKIPINAIDVALNLKNSTANVFLKGKNSKQRKKLFAVTFKSGIGWKIISVKNIKEELVESGYTIKKEVTK